MRFFCQATMLVSLRKEWIGKILIDRVVSWVSKCPVRENHFEQATRTMCQTARLVRV